MYYPSRYNHLVELKSNDNGTIRILKNLLFGATDIVNEEVYRTFLEGEKNGVLSEDQLSDDIWNHYIERGLVWLDPDAEESLVRTGGKSYGQRDEIAAGLNGGYYGFITSLHCNLACPYCFQRAKASSCGFLSKKQVDLGIDVINECENRSMELNKGKKMLPKISITGGEPLLRHKANLEVLDYLMSRLSELHWPYNITTNGTYLEEFVAEHDPPKNCRNVQVTLDGPREIHDQRRRYRNNCDSSFDKIIKGVDSALSDGWKITLRVNLDMNNVEHLPKLADFVQEHGWLESKDFSAYVSPVTDHGSLGNYDTPKDEADLLLALLQVVEKTPYIREVFDIKHFRGFNYVERILLHNDPRYPVIYRCEAVLGMYIFDPKGDVHVCLEGAGDSSMRIGSYDPKWELNDAAAARWMERNVLKMEECDKCKVRFICAGGCTMDGINHGNTARCMPFLREMDIAWQYYARNRPELFA
jgi:uncharacterized protein